MKISKKNLSRLIESLLGESELEMSLKEKAFKEINFLKQQGVASDLDNYLESISPNLNVSNILSPEVEIPLEENEVEALDDLISVLSEFIKIYLNSNEEHITGYIKDITPLVKYYDGAMVKSWYKDGAMHREGDKPALIYYYKEGSIWEENWYKDDKLYREGDKPAKIIYREDGSIKSESWYKDGAMHREGDKPAWIYYHKDGSILGERWRKDGKRHREGDKPAMVLYNKDGSVNSERWFKDGYEYTPGEGL